MTFSSSCPALIQYEPVYALSTAPEKNQESRDQKEQKMSLFAKKITSPKGSAQKDIATLTDLCRAIAAGDSPEILETFSGSSDLTDLAHAIHEMSRNSSNREITREIIAARENFAKLKEGDLEVRHFPQDRESEIGLLSMEVNAFANVVQSFLTEINETMRAVRDHKFSRRIQPDGLSGELLSYSESINHVIDQIQENDATLKNMTTKFIHNVEEMISSAADLAPKASAMSGNAKSTKDSCDFAVRSATETKMNVHTVASAAEELSSSIGEISHQVERSSALVTETVQDVGKTNDAIGELSTEVEEISGVLNIITEISGQTNLLALNATIEAARAGEAGKGFAVVANEVKSLAQKTAEATDKITTQLQKIQSVTKYAIGTVAHIGEKINEVKTISVSINDSMGEQSAATSEISRSAQMAATSTEEANKRIEDVNSGADETGNAALEMLKTVSAINDRGAALQADLNAFSAKIN